MYAPDIFHNVEATKKHQNSLGLIDPVFSECLQNVNTHTHTQSSPSRPLCGVFGPLDFLFFPPAISLLDTTWPPPLVSLRVWGVKCTINAIFMVSMMYLYFFNKYCTTCLYIYFVCVHYFFPPCLHLIYL